MRVAVTADVFDFFPMDSVVDFLAGHPRVRLDFLLSDTLADLIAEQIDIAFRGRPLTDSGYVGRNSLASAAETGIWARPWKSAPPIS